jgi:VWFA-related protein
MHRRPNAAGLAPRAASLVPAAAAALLLLAGTPSANQAPASEADLVSVDFIAIGPDGRLVRDLTPGDVVLRVAGRPREIKRLEYVELGTGELRDGGGVIARPLPPPYASNMLADAGRMVMMVINHESISPGRERPARDAAIKFLHSLSPRDRVGLATVPRGSTLVDPTRDHEQVRQALLQISGQAPQTTAPGLPGGINTPGQTSAQVGQSDRACMTRMALDDLAGILKTFDGEEPKAVVFVSSGLSAPTRDAAMNKAPGPCEVKPDHYEAVGAAARAARGRFYIVQPHELIVDSARELRDPGASRFATTDDALAGLQNLAGVTGAELFRLSGTQPDPVFRQVAGETSGYYLVDFQPEPSERNGLPHRVDVRVTAPDVVVRHQAQIVLGRLEGRKDPEFLSPHDMLRGVRRFRTLPLRAIAYPAQGQDGMMVLAIAEPADPSARITAAAMGIVDARNRLVRQWTADKQDLERPWLLASFPVNPGNYRLRVAAIDSDGRHGTLEYGFTASLTQAGPLRLSGIALGVSTGGEFEPRMMFGREAAATVYVEMYGRMPQPAVRIELAETTDGPALFGVAATVRDMGSPDRRIAIGALPMASLMPGDYLVRVLVTNDGKPLGTAARTLRKAYVETGDRR